MTVEVVLCEGVSPRQVLCDKFLVVATPVQRENICQKELCRLWKVGNRVLLTNNWRSEGC